jgi:thymidylate synthase
MTAARNGSAAILPLEAPILTSKHEEYQYLDLVREILDNGERRPDR